MSEGRRVDLGQYVAFSVGDVVRAFDPRTLGVVRHGRVIHVGDAYVRIDFGLTGHANVTFADILENPGPQIDRGADDGAAA